MARLNGTLRVNSSTSHSVLWVNEDNLVLLHSVTDDDGNSVLDASGTWEIRDSDNVLLATGSMHARSDGSYLGYCQSTEISLTEHGRYIVIVDLARGEDNTYRQLKVAAAYHGVH